MNLKYTYRGEEKTCEVKHRVDYVTVEKIIEAIVNNEFDKDGKYQPWKRYYLTWGSIVGVYTDIGLEDMEADDIYELIEDEAFIQGLTAIISKQQLLRIADCATKAIDVRLNEHPLKPICAKIMQFIDEAEELIKSEEGSDNVRKALVELMKTPEAQEFLAGMKDAVK